MAGKAEWTPRAEEAGTQARPSILLSEAVTLPTPTCGLSLSFPLSNKCTHLLSSRQNLPPEWSLEKKKINARVMTHKTAKMT